MNTPVQTLLENLKVLFLSISALQLKAGLKPAWSAVNLSKQIAAELKQIKSPVGK